MTQNNHDSIGDFLKIIRIRNRKSAKEIAKGLGIQPTAVSNWETGRNSISADRVDEVAKAYGMTGGEKDKLLELMDVQSKTFNFSPSNPELLLESQILCVWMTLPKNSRERISRMMKAYETSLEENE